MMLHNIQTQKKPTKTLNENLHFQIILLSVFIAVWVL